jgi:hypothetical protein
MRDSSSGRSDDKMSWSDISDIPLPNTVESLRLRYKLSTLKAAPGYIHKNLRKNCEAESAQLASRFLADLNAL